MRFFEVCPLLFLSEKGFLLYRLWFFDEEISLLEGFGDSAAGDIEVLGLDLDPDVVCRVVLPIRGGKGQAVRAGLLR